MAKKNGSTPTLDGGASGVSILSKYQGRTKLLNSAFLPNWDPEKAGEEILCSFKSVEIVKKGPKVDKDYNSYHFELVEWTNGVTFRRQENVIAAVIGLNFAASGIVMDEAMKQVQPGDKIVLTFNGFGKKKGKRNPAKLIEVHALG